MRWLTPGHALVTGASSGIGAAFARALPPDRPLLLTALDAEGLEAMRAELATAGRPVEVLAADLATPEGRAAVIAWAGGFPLALLINNAGVGTFGPLLGSDLARQRLMVEVNCLAPLELTHGLLPALLAGAAERGGRAGLVFVASVTAFLPLPHLAVYSASKAFDRFLGEALADELHGKPIAVLTVCPPATRTNFARAARVPGARDDGVDPLAVARGALRRLGRRSRVISGHHGRRFVIAISVVPRPLLRPMVRGVLRKLFRRHGLPPDGQGLGA